MLCLQGDASLRHETPGSDITFVGRAFHLTSILSSLTGGRDDRTSVYDESFVAMITKIYLF